MLDAIGSILGAGINAYTSYKNAQDANKLEKQKMAQEAQLNAQERADKQAALANANSAINSWETQANNILNNSMANQTKFSNAGDLAQYQQLKQNYNPADYVYNFDKFDTSKYNVEDYLNPQKDAILSDVAKAAQSTAAGTGMGRSSGAAQAINQSIVDKSESLYNQAQQQMNQDKSFDYNSYSNYINQMQNKLNTMQQGTMNQMNMLKGDLQLDQQTADQNTQNQLSLGNSITQSKAGLLL